MNHYKQIYLCILAPITIILASCTTYNEKNVELKQNKLVIEEKIFTVEVKEEIQQISLTFAGDLMAHSTNFNMKDYNDIYTDVKEILTNDDLSFINLETPIVPSLPMSNYPCFNVHTSYLDAAINAGFDVFSLANNHSLDQGNKGIIETLDVFNSKKNIYFSGLKKEKNEDIKPLIIYNDDWKILYLAVTEIMNFPASQTELVYYINPDKKSREKFIEKLKFYSSIFQYDIFVLSLHTFEPEYITEVSNEKKEWFKEIANAGVDVIWANHPHVLQKWEVIEKNNYDTNKNSLLIYSLGNFISGQRVRPNINNPEASREYTGDSVLLQINFSKIKGEFGFNNFNINPILITNYTDHKIGVPVVRQFNNKFLKSLSLELKNYYLKRFDLLSKYLTLLPMND